jgi:anaerobic selenocysteine-containing dehydrogenase
MAAQADPPLRMAWVERGNPIPQNPDTKAVREAFRRLEFRVVVEEFLTDTAREADIVLPAKTFFEQTDVIGGYWHDYLQLREKVIEPPGEVKPETEIYRLLAQRLGFPPELIARDLPSSGEREIETWLDARLAHLPGITVANLRRGAVRVPDAEEVAFADLMFPTPSGRIELDSAEAFTRWGVDPVPSYREPVESIRSGDAGSRARYGLSLLTPNTKNRIHSQFGNLATMRGIEPLPLLSIHPADASARGVRPGMRVRVFNDRGELFLAARFDHGLRPGCVSLHNGWWLADGAAVNVLSKGRETDMGHGAAFHENCVEVAPA